MGEVDLLFFVSSQHVPNVVPSGSQNVPQVPNVFPRTFPIIPRFLFILHCLAIVQHPCTKVVNGDPEGSRTKLLFWGGTMSRLLYWAVPNVPKLLVMGQWMWLLLGSLLGSAQCSKNIGDGPINVAPSQRKNRKIARVQPPPN